MADIKDINRKYPTRIPVIIRSNIKLASADGKHKYLVPKALTVSQFVHVLRKRMELTPEEGIFVLSERSYLLPSQHTFESVYQIHKSDDGMLYLTVTKENTFGSDDGKSSE
jgi:GABA(A) receptor-associated protein